jgi:hypothetical protein
MNPAAEALEDYFNCHHSYTSATLRKEVAERLFNVLTPDTVNTMYTIRTAIGDRHYSSLQAATQTENLSLTKRLIVELGADLLFSGGDGLHPVRNLLSTYAGGDGLHPVRNLLSTYAAISYWRLLWPDRIHPVRHDEIVDVLAAGILCVSDKNKLRAAFDDAILRSGITTEDRTELSQKLRRAIQEKIREAAWNRRRHLISLYESTS